MIFIKPGDESVFENFFVLLKSIRELEEKYSLELDLVVDNKLNDKFVNAKQLQEKYGINKKLSSV